MKVKKEATLPTANQKADSTTSTAVKIAFSMARAAR